MRFVDLFAGIGGFHQAMTGLGHECVFASERKENLAKLYEANYGISPNRDIRAINPRDIPDHEILCAGFPCQPFSKAGNQKGLKDKTNGSFFDVIVKILRVKKPVYFILENVRNIETHDEQRTWQYISENLNLLGYQIDKRVLSPHQYNIPQHRERLFIIGSLNTLDNFQWPVKVSLTTSVKDYLSNSGFRYLEPERCYAINVWQEFIDALSNEKILPGFPIWSMEFGANYPTDTPISELSNDELEKYKGSFGMPLKGLSYEEKILNLPRYAVKNKGRKIYPDWKSRWMMDNRRLYDLHKERLDPIVDKIKTLPIKSWQKFEWNCGDVERAISRHIVQFRASGVRIKKADFFPSLVTVGSQTPVIGWQNRYITAEEGLRIQSFNEIKLPENVGTCFGALGNAVNAKLVSLIAKNLIDDTIPFVQPVQTEFRRAAS